MAHKTLIGGTAYEVSGGKTLKGGTGYEIDKGRTLVGGTGYEISFINVPPLNDCSWAEIRQASDDGLAESYWAVGDRKAVKLSGTVGNLTLNGTYYCYIIGFNHNSGKEGTKRIHFQFGYTALSGGVHIAFTDSGYGNKQESGTWFNMNNTYYATGGWESSRMRSTVIPAFKNCLPTALKNVLKTAKKYTDNVGDGSNNASNVTYTSDSIFLLAEYEVTGVRDEANSAEQNYQQRYAYYAAGNPSKRYKHSATGEIAYWWLRSPAGESSVSWGINMNNSTFYTMSYRSYGFAPAFCV